MSSILYSGAGMNALSLITVHNFIYTNEEKRINTHLNIFYRGIEINIYIIFGDESQVL